MELASNRSVKLVDAARQEEPSFQICDSLLCVLHEIRKTQKKVNKLKTLSVTTDGSDTNTQS